MLKLKLQYFGHLMRRVDSLEKTLMLGGIVGQEEKGTTEDEMAGWHHWLGGPESQWTPGVGDGQGGLACCNSWGRRVGRNWETELNWTDVQFHSFFLLLLMLLVSYLRKYCLIQEYEDLHLSFKSWHFQLLHLRLWKIWVDFYIWCEIEIQIHSFTCRYPVVPTPFFKKAISSLFNCLGILSFFLFAVLLWDLSSLRPGIEPSPLAVKVQSPNHWSAREFCLGILIKSTDCVPYILELQFFFSLSPNSSS